MNSKLWWVPAAITFGPIALVAFGPSSRPALGWGPAFFGVLLFVLGLCTMFRRVCWLTEEIEKLKKESIGGPTETITRDSQIL